MALIACPECQAEISENAKSCPHCGNPLRPTPPAIRKRKHGCLWAIFFTLVGIFIIANIPTAPVRSDKAETLKAVELEYNWYKDGFGSVMELDVTIINKSNHRIKDVEITCIHRGKSGTVIDRNTRTIYESIDSKRRKHIEHFNMGFIHTQAASSSCSVTDLVVL